MAIIGNEDIYVRFSPPDFAALKFRIKRTKAPKFNKIAIRCRHPDGDM